MILEKGLLILTIAIAILTLGRFLFWEFPLELMTHFQVHYLWLTVALIIFISILRRYQQFSSRLALFTLLFAFVVNGLELANWYLPSDRLITDKANSLKVMSFNINTQNFDLDRIFTSIESVNPDLVLIIEINPTMMNRIETRAISRFPYRFRATGRRLAVFSKLPLEDSRSQRFEGSDVTNLVTYINYRNKRIQIIGTHSLIPVKSHLFARRNLHLKSITSHLEQENQPTILMGDFNLTPWSPYYRQFVDQAALHNTRLGFGILPTWIRPSTTVKLPKFILPLLNIPIDHIFVSKDFKVLNTYTGDNGNSDHAPIISELVIP